MPVRPYRSPIGALAVTLRERKIVGLRVAEEQVLTASAADDDDTVDWRAVLDRYFAGDVRATMHVLDPAGTDFERRVWEEARRIPAGETVTYGELARRIGRPGAARAVGQALHRNPILLFIPCHRIVPATTKRASGRGWEAENVGGFACGSERKAWLLEHERCERRRADRAV